MRRNRKVNVVMTVPPNVDPAEIAATIQRHISGPRKRYPLCEPDPNPFPSAGRFWLFRGWWKR